MSNNESNQTGQFPERRIKTDPWTGLTVLTGGPSFTKEDIARNFPVDCSRDAIILRRSVGLGKKDPFEGEEDFNLDNKEEVAKNFPRDCCRFARSIRRSVGLTGEGLAGGSDKCCFAE